MKVTGLDLSLTSTGWATFDDSNVGFSVENSLIAGSFGEKGKATDTLIMRQRRLKRAVAKVEEVARYSDLVVVEAHSFAGKGGSQHDRSGLWWLVVDELMSYGLPVLEVSPSSLKMYFTGKGTADKTLMLLTADRRHPYVGVKNDDEADAVGLVSIGLRILGQPLEEKLNAQQTLAFEKIQTIEFRR